MKYYFNFINKNIRQRERFSMMAENDIKVNKITEYECPFGHDVKFLMPVRYLLTLKPPVILQFQTSCHAIPTSWKLKIEYIQVQETGRVSCSISLQRTDRDNGFVDVCVWLSYVDSNLEGFRSITPICSSMMYADNIIEGTIAESRHSGLQSYIFSLGLFVHICVAIRLCHTPSLTSPKASLISNEGEIYRSKL